MRTLLTQILEKNAFHHLLINTTGRTRYDENTNKQQLLTYYI